MASHPSTLQSILSATYETEPSSHSSGSPAPTGRAVGDTEDKMRTSHVQLLRVPERAKRMGKRKYMRRQWLRVFHC